MLKRTFFFCRYTSHSHTKTHMETQTQTCTHARMHTSAHVYKCTSERGISLWTVCIYAVACILCCQIAYTRIVVELPVHFSISFYTLSFVVLNILLQSCRRVLTKKMQYTNTIMSHPLEIYSNLSAEEVGKLMTAIC